MAKDVQAALLDAVVKHQPKDKTVDDAMHLLFQWIQEKRYVKEIWA